MKNKLERKMFISILFGCVGFGFAMLGITVMPVLILAGLVFLVIAVIVNLTICCPHCGQHLTGRHSYGLPKFCPNCGTAIRDGEAEEI